MGYSPRGRKESDKTERLHSLSLGRTTFYVISGFMLSMGFPGSTSDKEPTCQCRKMKSESEVTQLCPTLATPWTVAHQAPPSMGFSRQEYWSGLPFPSPGESSQPRD